MQSFRHPDPWPYCVFIEIATQRKLLFLRFFLRFWWAYSIYDHILHSYKTAFCAVASQTLLNWFLSHQCNATCTFLKSIRPSWAKMNDSYQRGLSNKNTVQSFQSSESGNMMYNPKITPLTINVGPAATYEQPGRHANQPLQLAPQVSQQHLIERRNNCNKSCLITLILFICKFINILNYMSIWKLNFIFQ